MGYWRDRYGLQTLDFIRGVIAGVEAYAVWKDGRQVVGIREKYLTDVIEEIKKDLGMDYRLPRGAEVGVEEQSH
jgi:hypothetical protein